MDAGADGYDARVSAAATTVSVLFIIIMKPISPSSLNQGNGVASSVR